MPTRESVLTPTPCESLCTLGVPGMSLGHRRAPDDNGAGVDVGTGAGRDPQTLLADSKAVQPLWQSLT